MDRSALSYRKNVAGFILNQEGSILTCRRFDEHADWQLPQGGIDEGEDEDSAILRELYEEVLLENSQIIDKTPEFFQYEWPDYLLERGYRGQEQKLYLIESPSNFIPNLENAPTKEFKEFKWVSAETFLVITKETFRFPAYSKGLEYFIKNHPTTIKTS